jgi:hypothetical protein
VGTLAPPAEALRLSPLECSEANIKPAFWTEGREFCQSGGR